MIGMNAKKLVLIILLLLFFFTVISLPVFSQEKKAEEKSLTLDAEMRAEVVKRVGRLMLDHYIFKEAAEKMAEKLNTQLDEGKYSKIDDANEFSRGVYAPE
jgi:predicted Holliday junction resolvase-like endonuclease